MDIIASNPLRIIGVFANDPIRIRTANIGRIRAFSKVKKTISFSVDMQGFLGSFRRTLEAADSANLLLADKNKEAVYSLFWFHKNTSFDEQVIEDVCEDNCLKYIKSQGDIGEYSGFINAAVLALIQDDFSLATTYYTTFIESGSLLSDFREAISFPKSTLSNKEFIQRFVNCLIKEYPDVEWWPLFREKSQKKPVLNYIKTVFEKLAVSKIRQHIEEIKNQPNIEPRDFLTIAKKLKKDTINCVKVMDPLVGSERNAESQIALDKLGEEIIRECKAFYNISKFENEQSVLPTLQLTNYALNLVCGSDVIEIGDTFKKELEKDAELLPPKEVINEANDIRHEISSYCQKPDEIRWALILVRNCSSKLLQIKKNIGKTAPYYIKISTKVADNALFNCDAEVEKAVKMSMITDSQAQLSSTLRNAWKLQLDLNQLDIDVSLKNGKLRENESSIRGYIKRFGVTIDDITADISLQTEEELFSKCLDYSSLVNFCREYPDSACIKQAIQKMWKFEDDSYPKVVTIKSLLNYKQAYPSSHNDLKVRSQLESFLLGNTNGTIYDYRQFLRLYPDHNRKLEILHRIDILSFNQCHTIGDYQQYLIDFKTGAYRKQAESKVDDFNYSACKTQAELNYYVINNPNGGHCKEALDRIEDITYRMVCQNKKYQDYLERYPKGKYSTIIRNELENELFTKCCCISDYNNYITRYPSGQYVELAKRAIRKKKIYPFKVLGMITAAIALILFIVMLINSNSKSIGNVKEPKTSVQAQKSNTEDESIDITPKIEPKVSEVEEWGENHLQTGDKPYSSYFGKSRTGSNYLSFNTSGDCDYVIIVKRVSDARYVNHIYINGGDNAKIYLPDGHYNIYFYSGKGWNPNKTKGNLVGGFVSSESQQKDGPVELISAYGEYTLYPVSNGNLQLSSAGDEEIF